MRPITSLSVLALSATLALVACGDDTGGAGGGGGSGGGAARPTCDSLGEICHDTQTTLGQECHELGHDEANTEGDCKAREAECLAECQGGASTGSTSASSSGASTGSTSASSSSGSAASTGTGG